MKSANGFWAWFWFLAFMGAMILALTGVVGPPAHADAFDFEKDVAPYMNSVTADQAGVWVCAEIKNGISDSEISAGVAEYYHAPAVVVSLARQDICPLGW
jgi:hypothetical protein